jgi:hypothetical protein
MSCTRGGTGNSSIAALVAGIARIASRAAPPRQRANQRRDGGPGQRQQRHADRVVIALEPGQQPPESLRAREVLLARGEHDQDRTGAEPAGQEDEQAQARVVGPVRVVDHQCQRALTARALQEPRHGGEHARAVVDGDGCCRLVAQLGKQRRQLRARLRVEAADERCVVHVVEAEDVESGAERYHPVRLVGASGQHAPSVARRFLGHPFGEPRAAHSRLARDDGDLLLPVRRHLQAAHEDRARLLAADQR